MAVSIIKADLANAHHAQALFDVLNAYASDAMGGGKSLPQHVRDNLARELHKRPTAHVFLAFDGERAAGLATCIEGFSTFACKPLLNIHDLAVMPDYRGQGIGKRLIARVEEEALALGCCKVTLEVLEGNTVARALYRACGFDGYELDPATGKAMFMHKPLA